MSYIQDIIWLPGEESACNPGAIADHHEFHFGVTKIPLRRAWQPTSVFLPGESPRPEETGGLKDDRVAMSWRQLSNYSATELHS